MRGLIGPILVLLCLIGRASVPIMRLQNIRQHVEQHWLTLAFIAGFITDLILLNRVDNWFDNALLTFYITLATITVPLFYAGIALRFGERWSPRIERWSSILMQYGLGGLFSGMLIFYSKSGAILASWPFLLLIIIAIAGNELIKKRAQRLVFNLFAYFVGLFSFLALQLPILTGVMGGWMFFIAGLLALCIMYGLVMVLYLIIPNYLQLQMRTIVFVIFGTFALFQALYITNIIPPIPLSLKEITIAQSVTPVGQNYEVVYAPAPWWQVWQRVHGTFHPTAGQVACYTRVFAPTRITTEIYHVWDYQDRDGRWQEHATIRYPIVGGGDDGYRGYSFIQNYRDGVWRCRVETARGQVIGQQVFTIDSNQSPRTTRTVIE